MSPTEGVFFIHWINEAKFVPLLTNVEIPMDHTFKLTLKYFSILNTVFKAQFHWLFHLPLVCFSNLEVCGLLTAVGYNLANRFTFTKYWAISLIGRDTKAWGYSVIFHIYSCMVSASSSAKLLQPRIITAAHSTIKQTCPTRHCPLLHYECWEFSFSSLLKPLNQTPLLLYCLHDT